MAGSEPFADNRKCRDFVNGVALTIPADAWQAFIAGQK
jgi:hypothetical protein